jgi:hypothetical protein
MSLKKPLMIIAILMLPMLFAIPCEVSAQQYNDSPVILLGGGDTFTIESANYSVYEEFREQSVHISVITAQLFLNGMPYKMANIPITFSSDNDTVAVLEPLNRTRPSDSNGQAKILLIANNTVGIVNITAKSHIMYGHDIEDTCTVRVVGWGTVSGFVTDKNRNGVPNALVTLWHWNGTANDGKLRSPDNPQFSSDGRTSAIGTYTYTFVPQGQYNLTAEKDGHMYFAMVNVEKGTFTANVAIPDYVYVVPVTPEPSATATPVASPTTTVTPEPTKTPGFSLIITLISALLLFKVILRRQ